MNTKATHVIGRKYKKTEETVRKGGRDPAIFSNQWRMSGGAQSNSPPPRQKSRQRQHSGNLSSATLAVPVRDSQSDCVCKYAALTASGGRSGSQNSSEYSLGRARWSTQVTESGSPDQSPVIPPATLLRQLFLVPSPGTAPAANLPGISPGPSLLRPG